jgi:UDP-N-acetyl-D-mannosaminuronic acid dehydrogenase
MDRSHIAVIGLGYMGLPMAALLATSGHQVTGVDVDEKKLATLKKKALPFEEPGLAQVFEEAVDSGKLTFSNKAPKANFFIIAVPTPFVHSTRTSDLTYVRAASHGIAPVLKKGDIIILESTVPPATCTNVIVPILEKTGLKDGEDFHVVHCPERAFPGNTMHEIVYNDRLVGADNEKAGEITLKLYQSFVKGNIYVTNSSTAEMVKLMENTYRDVNIALANEFAKIAEENDVNIWEAIQLANKHPRVNVHLPGPGVGGHCIAIDPWFLSETSERANLIRAARHINDDMPLHVVRLATKMLPRDAKRVALLGVAYKPDVDDARETPASHIIELFRQRGYEVMAHDFHVKDPLFTLHELEHAVTEADVIILVTHHKEYLEIDPKDIGKLVRTKLLIDTRNHLDHAAWKKAGFIVRLLGNGRK